MKTYKNDALSDPAVYPNLYTVNLITFFLIKQLGRYPHCLIGLVYFENN